MKTPAALPTASRPPRRKRLQANAHQALVQFPLGVEQEVNRRTPIRRGLPHSFPSYATRTCLPLRHAPAQETRRLPCRLRCFRRSPEGTRRPRRDGFAGCPKPDSMPLPSSPTRRRFDGQAETRRSGRIPLPDRTESSYRHTRLIPSFREGRQPIRPNAPKSRRRPVRQDRPVLPRDQTQPPRPQAATHVSGNAAPIRLGVRHSGRKRPRSEPRPFPRLPHAPMPHPARLA